jgi:hypothetical protein
VSLALLGAFLAAGSGSSRGQEKKFDKPADAFDAFVKALKKDDLKAAHATLTTESGDRLTKDVLFSAVALKRFMMALDKTGKVAEAFEPVGAAMARHGLKEEAFVKGLEGLEKDRDDKQKVAAGLRKMFAPVKDQGAMLEDVVAALKKLRDPKKDNKKKDDRDARLSDVKVAGDRATGTATYKEGDREKSMTVHFEKVQGGWRLELPEELLQQGQKK